MTIVQRQRQWLVAAAVLALGLPVLVVCGFAPAIAASMVIETMRMGTSTGAWWAAGFVAICISHWFLVRWCVRVGGWGALFLGLGGCVLVVAAAFAMASFQQSIQPNDSMAGLGWGLLAYVLSSFVLLAAVMGAAARRIDFKRVAATSRLERTDNAGC